MKKYSFIRLKVIIAVFCLFLVGGAYMQLSQPTVTADAIAGEPLLLPAPEVSVFGKTITYSAVEGATAYRIKIYDAENNLLITDFCNTIEYTYDGFKAGASYTVNVCGGTLKTIGTNPAVFSLISAVGTDFFTVFYHDAPDIYVDSTSLCYESLSDISTYKIEVLDSKGATLKSMYSSELSVSLFNSDGVCYLSDGELCTLRVTGGIMQEISVPVVVGKKTIISHISRFRALSDTASMEYSGAPILNYEDGILSFSQISGADVYYLNVYKDGALAASSGYLTETSLNLAETFTNVNFDDFAVEYRITVQGMEKVAKIGPMGYQFFSYKSCSMIGEYKYTNLYDCPRITVKDKIVSFTAVESAEIYRIEKYDDTGLAGVTYTTGLSKALSFTPGKHYRVCVTAGKGTKTDFTPHFENR